ncbi:MAG TPA: hypothetical protein VHD87_02680 [Acidimicrobiales bacterium]|nr:hypothetical protein [Acidimicrobiales bacterium]
MPDPDDELDALRAADPVDPASVPSADSPEARVLYERITMTQPSGADVVAQARRRNRIIAAVATAIVVLGGASIALTRGDDDTSPNTATATTRGGAISPGGASMGSCVETYDLTTLTHRETAFDGTVERVAGDKVTFKVNEWYRGAASGAESSEVTLSGASTLGGQTSAGGAVSIDPGTRLLVAGDGGFAWSCGFTQPYSPTLARQWKDTIAG